MKKILKLIKLAALACILSVLVGCAKPANYQSMMVKPTTAIQQNTKLKGTIVVSNIIGGKKTNKMWTSQVDNESFKKALEGSLDAYGYLAKPGDKAKFKINAYLMKLEQPFAGFDLKVQSTVEYKIFDSKESVVSKRVIESSAKATVSDALYAPARLKIANEKSIQENIKEFLKYLSSF